MLLIREDAAECQLITEKRDDGTKDFFIEGIFMQGNLKNKNGRIYPVEVLEKEVARYVKEDVDNKRAYGELGHPEGPAINLDRVSHRIVSLKREGDNFIGKAQVSSTPMGKIARAIIEDGGQLGVSSRGMGSVKVENGIQHIQDDFKLSTAADIVANPSAPSAYVNGIMEGVSWWFDIGTGLWKTGEIIDEQVSAIKKMSLEEIDKNKAAMFNRFVRSLSKV